MAHRTIIRIESREHLLATLSEAAELEHALMCMYLFAAFSLKESIDEDLTAVELDAVVDWRQKIVGICVQEMTHLALVNNLITSLGGTAHFARPSFPIRSGLFPADFALNLAPFDLATLEHFIFLERSEDSDLQNPVEMPDVAGEAAPKRGTERRRLMAHIGDYSTVGELYTAIEAGIHFLCERDGETKVFCGSAELQLDSRYVELDGLAAIRSRKSAHAAIRLIVDQGEGARSNEASHFATFTTVREQFLRLREARADFEPARPVARNPAMRRPIRDEGRCWIDAPESARILDLANAIYALMLRFLVQFYSGEARPSADKKVLSNSAFSLMGALGRVSSLLSQLPATQREEAFESRAGISFELNRYLSPFETSCERFLLTERVDQILAALDQLGNPEGLFTQPHLDKLRSVRKIIATVRTKLQGGAHP